MELEDLSDMECGWILNVVQRDFELRDKHDCVVRKDDEALVKKMETCREHNNKNPDFNQKYCTWCFSRFFIFFNPKTKCEMCTYMMCNKCRTYNKDKKCYICYVCQKSLDIQSRNMIFYNRKLLSKFLQTGSEVVVAAYRSRMREKASLLEITDDISESDLDNDSKSIDSGYGHGGGSIRAENSKKPGMDFSDGHHGTSNGIWPIREESSDIEIEFHNAYDDLDLDTIVGLNSTSSEYPNNNDKVEGKRECLHGDDDKYIDSLGANNNLTTHPDLDGLFLSRQSANQDVLRHNPSVEEMINPGFKRSKVFMPGIHHVNCKLCSMRYSKDSSSNSRRLTL
ncbi:unnamed protein product [Owenia fusiformis]|uniref:Uncharacterized protein n=1 Tax=Owenia fusiformis TaxID=6347 RepID=A0A8J1TLW2_OWEFU|nr:unnamed protein product [Owenia fusiformis]